MYGKMPYAFPAAFQITGLGAISDALVGRIKYDDPKFLHEVSILLGGHKTAQVAFLENWGTTVKAKYQLWYHTIVAREREVYGAKAFFHGRDEFVAITSAYAVIFRSSLTVRRPPMENSLALLLQSST